MKPWAILGLLLLLGGFVVLVVLREPPTQSASSESWLIELSARLDGYARLHDGRYPASLEELDETGLFARSAGARDPYGRHYVYELNPLDERKCRVYTLGRDGEPAEQRDPSEVVLYRIAGRSIWRASLLDVPREW